ncbi:MAG: DUF2271 domain-containing protein [Pirellulales bacterium]|nr:DUF2271 domain-containing protein [Pirellulales bacterium]
MKRILFASLGLLVCACTANSEQFTFHHEHVLGTSLQLKIDAPSRQVADQVEAASLREIDRLAAVLSRHDPRSELSVWQREEHLRPLSDDLVNVLRRAEHWRHQSQGAFDVRATALTNIVQAFDSINETTTARLRSDLASFLSEAPYTFLPGRKVSVDDGFVVSLDALAKGYILDRVCFKVRQKFPQLDGLTVNIGGDLRRFGKTTTRISVTDPFNASEGADVLTSFETSSDMAVATSGGYRRHVATKEGRQSHLIDPRTAEPVTEIVSATVIAPTGIDADAAATTIAVLGVQDGLRLIEKLAHFECLMVTRDGEVATSSGWPPAAKETHFVSDSTSSTSDGLIVDFKLNRPRGRRYRRPYVAVWLEDMDGFPVKTAVLWLQTEQPGPRWHRDLTRWYRNDRMRKIVEKSDLIGTISGATRGPGEYQARFDGTDNAGKPLSDGKYVLCLEVAREHGTYQIIRETIELDGKPLAEKMLQGNVEVGGVKYRYNPPADVR